MRPGTGSPTGRGAVDSATDRHAPAGRHGARPSSGRSHADVVPANLARHTSKADADAASGLHADGDPERVWRRDTNVNATSGRQR